MQLLPTVSRPPARPTDEAHDVDAEALAAELRRHVSGEVRFDAGSRALYTTDSAIFRRVPIGVVLPRHADDVAATLAACREYGAPVLPRGGGTSISGNSCNVAVVIDMSKYMNRIVELDPARQIARVQPGVICDSLRDAAEKHHLTFAPDPSTHNRCNLGGMIGNNSCGTHSMMGGRTADNIHELDVITYDGTRMRVGPADEDEINHIVSAAGRRGEIYARLRMIRGRYAELVRQRYPQIPRQCSGYNLDRPPPLDRRAVVHGHCHHKSIMRMGGEEKIIQQMGLDYGKILDSGCCGMAGSFGFEAGHYDISMKIGAQRLFPAVEAAATDDIIIADGFSCRHQILEATDRQAMHLAQVLKMAYDTGPTGPPGGFPELRYPEARFDGPERMKKTLRTAAIAGGILLAGGAALALTRRRRS